MNEIIPNALNNGQPPEDGGRQPAPQAGSFKDEVPWLSILQLIGSLLIFLILLGFAALLGLVALLSGVPLFSQPVFFNQLVVLVLVVPSIWLSFKQIIGADFSLVPTRLLQTFSGLVPYSIILFIPLLLMGTVLANDGNIGLLFSLITAAAVLIPVRWLVWYAGRGLEKDSAQLNWGMLTIGMTLSPWLVVLMNLLIGLIVMIVVILLMADKTWIPAEFYRETIFVSTFNPDVNQIIERLSSWISFEKLALPVLLFIAVFTPLIEEFFKAVGLWMIGKRIKTPAEGFKMGVIAGAGFALVESLNAGLMMEDWGFTIFMRALVGLVHITASGLLGWGLVRVWQRGAYWKSILYYLGAVFIHGFWNAFVVLTSFSAVGSGDQIFEISRTGSIVLIIGAVIVFLGTVSILNLIRRSVLSDERPRRLELLMKES